jgi:hypothetical protein
MAERATEMTRLKGFLIRRHASVLPWGTKMEWHPVTIEPCPGVLRALVTDYNVIDVTPSLCKFS